MTTYGRLRRWIVLHPNSGGTGFVLASQTGDRVTLLSLVPDFERRRWVMCADGDRLLCEQRAEPSRSLVVFLHRFGNRWDLPRGIELLRDETAMERICGAPAEASTGSATASMRQTTEVSSSTSTTPRRLPILISASPVGR